MEIYSTVQKLVEILRDSSQRLVLAESCTGGMVAATLTSIPGVSDLFCGSMVVYRNQTKTAWLGLPDEILLAPNVGPVSRQASLLLAQGVLQHTPEATLAVSITGHFGPDAPEHLNRKIFMACAQRNRLAIIEQELLLSGPPESLLSMSSPNDAPRLAWERRRWLQSQAALETIAFATQSVRRILADRIS